MAVHSSIVPAVELEKTASPSTDVEPGDVVTYTFTVENTGNDTLNNITVTDPLPGLSTPSCLATTLLPAATTTCTATYAVTQDDVDAGSVENTATGDGDCDGCPPITPPTETIDIPTDEDTGIDLDKSSDVSGLVDAGDVITYIFTVTNTGDVTLTNIVVSDPLPGLGPISCPTTTLTAGDSMDCTASYTVTEDDAIAGSVFNHATATGTDPDGGTSIDEDDDDVQTNLCLVVQAADEADEDDAAARLSRTLAGVPMPNAVRVNVALAAAVAQQAEDDESGNDRRGGGDSAEEPPVEEPPVEEPTEVPTEEPTEAPTEEPTEIPSEGPTEAPSEEPTEEPTTEPTATTAAPVAIVDTATTAANTAVKGDARANDSDADTALDALTYTLGDPTDNDDGDPSTIDVDELPAYGTVELQANGRYLYTPDTDFSGVDDFVYTVTDQEGNVATSTVTITVDQGWRSRARNRPSTLTRRRNPTSALRPGSRPTSARARAHLRRRSPQMVVAAVVVAAAAVAAAVAVDRLRYQTPAKVTSPAATRPACRGC